MPNSDYTKKNCYEVLNISWNASPEEIRVAYFKKSKQTHPDLGGTHELQLEVNNAFDVLSDPLTRERHDRFWRNVSGSYKAQKKETKQQEPQSSNVYKKKSSTFDSLYSRVTEEINHQLISIRSKHEGWVRERTAVYKQKFESWHQEKERSFVESVEHYKSLLFEKLKNKTFYALLAILMTLFSIFSTLLISETSIEFLRLPVIILWLISGFTWIKYHNNKFIIIDGNSISIEYPDCETRISQSINNMYHSQEISISTIKLGYDQTDWQKQIDLLVEKEWTNLLNREEAPIFHNKELFMSYVAEICEIAGRNITFDSSEEQAARRIATTFFFMGYIPKFYIDQARMFIMSDGSENIAIRFRHRRGTPTNLRYLKRMVEEMETHIAYRGFIFCTPGLSLNAQEYARKHKITWYSLESMNEWIENVNNGGYEGPPGDIFDLLYNMIHFLSRISIALPN